MGRDRDEGFVVVNPEENKQKKKKMQYNAIKNCSSATQSSFTKLLLKLPERVNSTILVALKSLL